MIGLAELALYLAPLAAFLAWRLLGPRVTPLYLGAALLAVLAIAGTGLGLFLRHRVDRREVYVPAHMQDGVIVPGQAVRR